MSVQLSLSLSVCLSIHILFPPNKHFTYVSTFHLYVKIYFYTDDAQSLVTGHWSLAVYWLGFHALTAKSWSLVLTGNQNSCFKLLQAKPPLYINISTRKKTYELSRLYLLNLYKEFLNHVLYLALYKRLSCDFWKGKWVKYMLGLAGATDYKEGVNTDPRLSISLHKHLKHLNSFSP